MHRVLINTFTSARRRRWNGEQPVETVPEVAGRDAFEERDVADAACAASRRLPQDQRIAVVLRYYANLDEMQMAAALEVAPGTVKSRLSRALRVLADDPTLSDLRGAP